jgi:hypothetical protein
MPLTEKRPTMREQVVFTDFTPAHFDFIAA